MTETGVVKKYVADRGFGFIQPDLDGNDVFVHVNEASEEILIMTIQSPRI